MNVWIATQDKKSITVDGKKIEEEIGSASLDQWSKILGKYDSKGKSVGSPARHLFEDGRNGTSHHMTYTMPEK